ncbi:hypothetical protein Ddye_029299 [Dipteronia dyeriana]|uniref:Reverse transcriptase domain-containing protein n=1 Tax=Dipteronia dyeriana TaxID=168575 RepID=A0AAD9TEB4_9ROSI|nr:hypothetical protein Ddye_029299 [Dipteronia dyeriana]
MPIRGLVFSWSNNRVNGNWARLDRFLVSPSVLSWFPDLVQMGLPRSISDHSAITIGISIDKGGPMLFRFNNEWLHDRELMCQVKKEWLSSKIKGSSSFSLSSKLKRSKKLVKIWVVDRKSTRSSPNELKVGLAVVDEKTDDIGWSDILRKERVENLTVLWKEIRREEVSKSNSEEIRAGAADYFEKHFKNVMWRRLRITGLPLQRLSELYRVFLEEAFSLEEVWLVVSSCDGNKAPGPDGFNLNFIKENWKVIKDDFMRFMIDFHHNGAVVKELNHTFTTLIPKCLKLKVMKDFRLISLVSSVFKVLAKVLANRLNKVIGSVVGEHQMAFVQYRQILDSFVIVEEIIHHWKMSKDGGLMVKLDFEKTYDSLNYNFLDDILNYMGFG